MANMKPFQIILLAVFGLMALIGLVLFATFSGFGGGGKSVGKVLIWGTFPQDVIEHELSELGSSNKAFVNVTYKQMPAGNFDANLAEALASASGPDLVIISQEQLLTEVPKIAIIPFKSLPQRTYVDTYVPEASLFLSSTGTYGIPYLIDPLMMYYNQSMLSGAGVAQPPNSWEAITGLTQRLSSVTASQSILKSGVALGGYDNVTNARAIMSLLFLQSGNPVTRLTDTGFQSALSDTSSNTFGATPAESAMNFYTQFANPTKTVYSWNPSLPESRRAFLAGDLAFYFGFASERQSLADANPNLKFDMAPVPQAAKATSKMTYGNLYAFAFPKASGNLSGAYAVASALSDSAPMTLVARELGMAPAKRALLSARSDDLYAPVYYPEVLTATGWLSPSIVATERVFATMIDSITTGRKDTQNALQDAGQSLNAVLR